jgi:hypothetical protein
LGQALGERPPVTSKAQVIQNCEYKIEKQHLKGMILIKAQVIQNCEYKIKKQYLKGMILIKILHLLKETVIWAGAGRGLPQ